METMEAQLEAMASEFAASLGLEMSTDGDVTVNVKFLHQGRASFECSLGLTVAELKQKVAKVTGGDGGASMRLIYKGKVLKDEQTLSQCGFRHEDTIHAVAQRRSGGAPAQPAETVQPARSTSQTGLPVISATPFADFLTETLRRCDDSLQGNLDQFFIYSSEYMRRLFPDNLPFGLIQQRLREWRSRALVEIADAMSFALAKEGEVSILREEIRSETTDNRLNFFMRDCLTYNSREPISSSFNFEWCSLWFLLQIHIKHGHPRVSKPDQVVFTAMGRLLGRLPAERPILVFNFIMCMMQDMSLMSRAEQEIGDEHGMTVTASMQTVMQMMNP